MIISGRDHYWILHDVRSLTSDLSVVLSSFGRQVTGQLPTLPLCPRRPDPYSIMCHPTCFRSAHGPVFIFRFLLIQARTSEPLASIWNSFAGLYSVPITFIRIPLWFRSSPWDRSSQICKCQTDWVFSLSFHIGFTSAFWTPDWLESGIQTTELSKTHAMEVNCIWIPSWYLLH